MSFVLSGIGAKPTTKIAKVVIFNGPPRCGKDTICDLLKSKFEKSVIRTRFAETLKQGAHALLGLSVPTEAFNDVKDVKQELLNNHTWREWYIWIAEHCMKQFLGDEAFGKILVSRLSAMEDEGLFTSDKVVVLSDCGFEQEMAPVVRHFGEDNCVLIRIHRQGHDFSNDSRGYVQGPALPYTFDVLNPEGNIDLFYARVIRCLTWAKVMPLLDV